MSHAELYHKLKVYQGQVFHILSLFPLVFSFLFRRLPKLYRIAARVSLRFLFFPLAGSGPELRDHFTRLMRVAADVIT